MAAIEPRQLRKLMRAFVDALRRLPADDLSLPTSADFARRFNELLVLAQAVAPDTDQRLWPKPVAIQDAGGGPTRALASYVELETYARQVLDLLPPRGIGLAFI